MIDSGHVPLVGVVTALRQDAIEVNWYMNSCRRHHPVRRRHHLLLIIRSSNSRVVLTSWNKATKAIQYQRRRRWVMGGHDVDVCCIEQFATCLVFFRGQIIIIYLEKERQETPKSQSGNSVRGFEWMIDLSYEALHRVFPAVLWSHDIMIIIIKEVCFHASYNFFLLCSCCCNVIYFTRYI